MKETPTTSADNILESLNDSLDKSNSKADKALAKEEMECEEDESEDCNDDEDEDTNRPPTKQKLKKNTLHPLIMKNPWEVGNELFAQKNVVEQRAEALRQRIKKSDVSQCIMTGIADMQRKACIISVGEEMEGIPSWQRYFRGRKNNLSLKS